MALCEACGIDNRDKAMFCRGCARSLIASAEAPKPPAPAPGPSQVCSSCGTANPLAATVCKSCQSSLVPFLAAAPRPAPANRSAGTGLGKAWVMAGLVLMVGAGSWWGFSGSAPARPTAVSLHSAAPVESSGATADSPDPVARPASAGAALPAQPAVSAQPPSSSDREQRVREERRLAAQEKKRQQAAREQAAASERDRIAVLQEQQRAQRLAQQKAAQDAASQAQLARASAPPASPPAALKTVEQTCSASGNFLSREVCRFQSCRETAFVNDPVCVRFRQVEEANRQRMAN